MAEEPTTATDAHGAQAQKRRLIGIIVASVLLAVVIGAAIVALTAPGAPTGAAATDVATSSLPGPTSSASAGGGSTPSEDPSAATDPSAPGGQGTFPELSPVAPDQQGVAPGVAVALTKFESVTGEVVAPGDVQAAAVRVTIQIRNTSDAPLDLDVVVVNAYIGAQRDPASTYEQPGGIPFSGSLDPGATATGVYLFRIPEDRRSDVTFVVDYRGGEPAIAWRGAVVDN